MNHNGSLETALALVDAAAAAGADVVKFQTFRADALASAVAPKADYQIRQTGAGESQLEMLRRLELSVEAHEAIVRRCAERGVRFLSAPFDLGSLDLLIERFGLTQIKLGSGELTNAPLLLAAARKGRRLILSTGMATLADIEQALGVAAFGILAAADAQPSRAAFNEALSDAAAWPLLRERVILLHCTTEYPASLADTNLRAMDTLRAAFGLEVGYSDHTEGVAVSIAAAACGATMIEKHLTLDRGMEGPDHAASIEPQEFRAMTDAVRAVELALGTGLKQPGAAERANRAVARKSVVAARPIRRGQVLTADDLAVKRPGSGRPPVRYWDTIGSQASRDYTEGEPIDE